MASGSRADSLRGRPASERRKIISKCIDQALRAALGIVSEESLEGLQNYFELGMTSLGIVEMKEKLAAGLEIEINEADFYKNPTIDRLTEHLLSATASPS